MDYKGPNLKAPERECGASPLHVTAGKVTFLFRVALMCMYNVRGGPKGCMMSVGHSRWTICRAVNYIIDLISPTLPSFSPCLTLHAREREREMRPLTQKREGSKRERETVTFRMGMEEEGRGIEDVKLMRISQ